MLACVAFLLAWPPPVRALQAALRRAAVGSLLLSAYVVPVRCPVLFSLFIYCVCFFLWFSSYIKYNFFFCVCGVIDARGFYSFT